MKNITVRDLVNKYILLGDSILCYSINVDYYKFYDIDITEYFGDPSNPTDIEYSLFFLQYKGCMFAINEPDVYGCCYLVEYVLGE